MPEETNAPEEKKKYQIIDKRRAADEDNTPAEAAVKPEPPAPRDAPQEEPAGEQEPRRAAGIEDAFAFILNLLREQALASLGMLAPGIGPDKPESAKAEQAAGLFRALCAKFPDLVHAELPEDKDFAHPEIDAIVMMCFNILQSQIIVHMGLIADPATGLVVKNMANAQKGIDIFAALIDLSAGILPREVRPQLEGLLSDLRLNYVAQLNKP